VTTSANTVGERAMHIQKNKSLLVNHANGEINNINHEVLVLTVKECARELKVSSCTLRRWISTGKVPLPRKIGHLLRWDAKEFYLWWNNGTLNQKEFEDFKKAIKNQRRNGI
jgi:excisionase family DNA binding protein